MCMRKLECGIQHVLLPNPSVVLRETRLGRDTEGFHPPLVLKFLWVWDSRDQILKIPKPKNYKNSVQILIKGLGWESSHPKALNQWCELRREGSWNHNFNETPGSWQTTCPSSRRPFPVWFVQGCDACQEVGTRPISARGWGIPLLAASIPAQREALKPSSAALLQRRCIPPAQGMLQHPRGAAPSFEASSLQPVSFWSHTELNLEQVLRDQRCLPHIKPCRKADYPRPDVAFCSRCGAGTECVGLSAPSKLFLPSPQLQHEDTGEPASMYFFVYLNFSGAQFRCS